MAQERDARARPDRCGIREEIPGQGERIYLLSREDHVGDVRGRRQEGRLERSGESRESARSHDDADAARRSRNACRQPSAPAGALRVDAVEESEVRRRGLRARVEDRRQGRGQIDAPADDVQDGAAEVAHFAIARNRSWRRATHGPALESPQTWRPTGTRYGSSASTQRRPPAVPPVTVAAVYSRLPAHCPPPG